VKDTTGCGDAFAAGFLFGWCGSRDVQRGLVYGCACGAAAVGITGGSEPLSATSVNACMRRNEGVQRAREVRMPRTAAAGASAEAEGEAPLAQRWPCCVEGRAAPLQRSGCVP